MKNGVLALALGLAFVGLMGFTAQAEDAGAKDTKGKGGGRSSMLSLEGLDKALTGDLALTAEQRPKITEAWDKIMKPVMDKISAAQDKKAAGAEMRPAREAYLTELKKILNEKQYAKVDEMMKAMPNRKGGGGGQGGGGGGAVPTPAPAP